MCLGEIQHQPIQMPIKSQSFNRKIIERRECTILGIALIIFGAAVTLSSFVSLGVTIGKIPAGGSVALAVLGVASFSIIALGTAYETV